MTWRRWWYAGKARAGGSECSCRLEMNFAALHCTCSQGRGTALAMREQLESREEDEWTRHWKDARKYKYDYQSRLKWWNLWSYVSTANLSNAFFNNHKTSVFYLFSWDNEKSAIVAAAFIQCRLNIQIRYWKSFTTLSIFNNKTSSKESIGLITRVLVPRSRNHVLVQ